MAQPWSPRLGRLDFLVRRDELGDCRFEEGAVPEPDDGQALLEVSAFGLTTNNITYAVFGDAMSYWDFFPADDGWGRVPMWGFADVVESRHDRLAEATRVFGYLPPSTHLLVSPDHVGDSAFIDASPHRAHLPAAYNRYARVEADPLYEPRFEDHQMLLWPLFFTSFLLDDFLADESFFGAEMAVLSSASSRTASSAAFLLSRRDGIDVVGLTSPRNVEFVGELGVYDHVVSYDEIDSLPEAPALYADMAGDAAVRAAVHEHFGDTLRHDATVGATHHDRLAGADELPGPRPKFFFAPDRLAKRAEDWGREGLNERFAEAWPPYLEWTGGWLEVKHDAGPEALERTYREMLEGNTDPSAGHVLTLLESS